MPVNLVLPDTFLTFSFSQNSSVSNRTHHLNSQLLCTQGRLAPAITAMDHTLEASVHTHMSLVTGQQEPGTFISTLVPNKGFGHNTHGLP